MFGTTGKVAAAPCRGPQEFKPQRSVVRPEDRAPDAAHFCANYLAGLSSGSLSYRRRLRVPNDQGFVRFATCISWYSRLA